jgi:hypothetical protein
MSELLQKPMVEEHGQDSENWNAITMCGDSQSVSYGQRTL